MTKIQICPYFDMDIMELHPIPPQWWLTQHTAPEELNISNEQELFVRRYCYLIAVDDSTSVRSIFHKAVCQVLDLEQGEFLPFEDESITKIPTPDESLEIFWKALKKYREQK